MVKKLSLTQQAAFGLAFIAGDPTKEADAGIDHKQSTATVAADKTTLADAHDVLTTAKEEGKEGGEGDFGSWDEAVDYALTWAAEHWEFLLGLGASVSFNVYFALQWYLKRRMERYQRESGDLTSLSIQEVETIASEAMLTALGVEQIPLDDVNDVARSALERSKSRLESREGGATGSDVVLTFHKDSKDLTLAQRELETRFNFRSAQSNIEASTKAESNSAPVDTNTFVTFYTFDKQDQEEGDTVQMKRITVRQEFVDGVRKALREWSTVESLVAAYEGGHTQLPFSEGISLSVFRKVLGLVVAQQEASTGSEDVPAVHKGVRLAPPSDLRNSAEREEDAVQYVVKNAPWDSLRVGLSETQRRKLATRLIRLGLSESQSVQLLEPEYQQRKRLRKNLLDTAATSLALKETLDVFGLSTDIEEQERKFNVRDIVEGFAKENPSAGVDKDITGLDMSPADREQLNVAAYSWNIQRESVSRTQRLSEVLRAVQGNDLRHFSEVDFPSLEIDEEFIYQGCACTVTKIEFVENRGRMFTVEFPTGQGLPKGKMQLSEQQIIVQQAFQQSQDEWAVHLDVSSQYTLVPRIRPGELRDIANETVDLKEEEEIKKFHVSYKAAIEGVQQVIAQNGNPWKDEIIEQLAVNVHNAWMKADKWTTTPYEEQDEYQKEDNRRYVRRAAALVGYRPDLASQNRFAQENLDTVIETARTAGNLDLSDLLLAAKERGIQPCERIIAKDTGDILPAGHVWAKIGDNLEDVDSAELQGLVGAVSYKDTQVTASEPGRYIGVPASSLRFMMSEDNHLRRKFAPLHDCCLGYVSRVKSSL